MAAPPHYCMISTAYSADRIIGLNHNIRVAVVAHAQKQITALQENGQPRLLLLLLPDQNRSGNTSQKQPCVCVRQLAFSEKIRFSLISTALSPPDSSASTKIVCACVCLRASFCLPLQHQVMGIYLTVSGLCVWAQDKSTD